MATTAAPRPPPHKSPSGKRSFDLSELPSVTRDGISSSEEAMKRRKTCRFIEEAARLLKLPRVATATAMVFFHRFYAKHSFNEHDRFEVAVACLLLAAKTEEAPRKVFHVIDECHKLRHRAIAAGRMSQNSKHHPSASSSTGSLDPKGEEFMKLKERILLLERVVLHTIGFEISVDHPYKFLVDQIKKLITKRSVEYRSPEKPKEKLMQDLVQYSMNFANDSMQTSLCLQFDAEKIALACVYLGGQFAKVRPTQGKTWAAVLEVTDVEAMATISVQILELLSEKKGGSQQELFKMIRADLDKMRSTQRPPAAATRPPPPSASRGRTPPPPRSPPAPPKPPPPDAKRTRHY